jgi:hypothetical protein
VVAGTVLNPSILLMNLLRQAIVISTAMLNGGLLARSYTDSALAVDRI